MFIDDKAIRFIKEILKKENADAVRIFTSGGGCCKRFEITPIKKAISGDVVYKKDGLCIYIEKELVDISIRLDEKRGLVIEFK